MLFQTTTCNNFINFDFEANTWKARASSIGQERQSSKQSL